MKVFVLTLCLAMAVGDHDATSKSEPDEYCRIVTIFLNPVIQSCQTLRQASLALSHSESDSLFYFQFYRVTLMLSVPVTALNNLHKLSMIVVMLAMLM